MLPLVGRQDHVSHHVMQSKFIPFPKLLGTMIRSFRYQSHQFDVGEVGTGQTFILTQPCAESNTTNPLCPAVLTVLLG
jgi:hypothetical protein